MGRLAGFRYREVIKRLKALGFAFHRQAAGSHEIWFNLATNRLHNYSEPRWRFAGSNTARDSQAVRCGSGSVFERKLTQTSQLDHRLKSLTARGSSGDCTALWRNQHIKRYCAICARIEHTGEHPANRPNTAHTRNGAGHAGGDARG